MWGDQTWEEMAVAFFEVSRPRNGDGNLQSRSIAQRSNRDGDSINKASNAPNQAAIKYAEDYLAKWDSNGDGIVSWEESPRVLRDFGFSRIDRDNDRQITREELIQAGQSGMGQGMRRGGQ
jgi:hypothetical protein